MSGASIPYHLRPHKSVDRRLFLDLLGRFERWRPLSNYVYISMGAYPLEDHKLIFRLLGITRLIAFDFDSQIVARQLFNKPADTCHCLHKKSGDLVSGLEQILKDCELSDSAGVVVWLDYTDPSKLSEQIREFETLLDGLKPGDVVRVIVNANLSAVGKSTDGAGKQIPAHELRALRLRRLKERIGDYLPSWADQDHMTEDGLPAVLAAALGAAALKALPSSGRNAFVPLSIVRYADGQQMLSITGTVAARGTEDQLRKSLDLKSWPFASEEWTVVHRLVVPVLTIRERLFLERGIVGKSSTQLMADLGFDFDEDSGIDMHEFLDSYKSYYRFYPTLLPAEL